MADSYSSHAKITLDASQYNEGMDEAAQKTHNLGEAAEQASGKIDSVGPALNEQAKHTQKVVGETDKATDSTAKFAQTRYALYDVSSTWTMVSAATLGASAAVLKVSSDYEYAFSAVQRVTQTAGAEAAEMKQDLKDLASTIHEEFDSIAEVATLGGQMGVASDEIKEFTRNVTMFGATTNATVQETATGFGRIAQMTKAGEDAWENIGSAIYQVGINSVATESQILNVAQEIATAGNLAGFTTDEVIGLSGALASLNVRPERARGNVLRFFSEIDQAIAEGGEGLNQYAKTARMSADEFAAAWESTPEQAFRTLLEGMKAAADEGQNLGQVIRDLGIVNVRDQQTYQQLANNIDLYVESMGHANEAYREGSALADAYGIRSDTVIGKLQILRNVVANILDSLGNNKAVKLFLDALTSMGRLIEWVLKLPLAAWAGSAVVVIMGLVGAVAAARAAFAVMQASVLGMELAMANLKKMNTSVDLSFLGLINTLNRFSAANKKAAADTTATTGALNTQKVAAQQTGAALTGASVGAGRFGTAVKGITGLLRGVGPLLLITGAMVGLGKVLDVVKDKFKSNEERAKEMFGSFSGLSEAIRQDTEIYEESGEAIRTLLVNTEDGEIIWDSAADSQRSLADAIADTTDEIETQTVALGKNYEQAILDSIMGSEDFADSWRDLKVFAEEFGVSIEDVVKGIQNGTAAGLFEGMVEKSREQIDATLDDLKVKLIQAEGLYENAKINLYDPNLTYEERDAILENIDAHQAKVDAIKEDIAAEEARLELLNRLIPAIQGLTGVTDDAASKAAAQGEFLAVWGDVLEDVEEGTLLLSDAVALLFSEMDEAHKAEAALESLTRTLLENGTGINELTAEGRASFGALMDTVNMFAVNAGDDMAAFGIDMINMFAYAEGAGIQFGDEVDFLKAQMISAFDTQWGISIDTSAAHGSINQFIKAVEAALRARAAIEGRAIAAAGVRAAMRGDAGGVVEAARQGAELARDINSQLSQLQTVEASLSSVRDRGAEAADAFYNPPGRGGGGGGGGKSPIGKDAKDAQAEVRTLTDFVKDLTSVAKDAFDFRFGLTISTDELEAARRSINDMKADALQKVADAFEALDDSRQRVKDLQVSLRELQATITGLTADQSKLQYFYEIAVEYGDTARAEQIAAELERVQADLAKAENDRVKEQKALAKGQEDVTKKTEDLSQAQADAKRTLTENTESSAAQRKAVMDLAQAYQNQIIELINSGASQKDVEKKSKELQKQFENELKQLGYNREEVKKYSKAFEDLSVIIKKIPPANVKANVNPAIRAVDDFIARTNKRSASVKVNATAPRLGNLPTTGISVGGGGISTPRINVGAAGVKGGSPGGKTTPYATGGYTGAGNKYAAAGIVHRGEYVFPKSAVNQTTGLPHADVMARMMMGTRDFRAMVGRQPSPVQSGRGMMDLSPRSIQALAQAVQPYLVVQDKVIAQANGADARRASNVGRN